MLDAEETVSAASTRRSTAARPVTRGRTRSAPLSTGRRTGGRAPGTRPGPLAPRGLFPRGGWRRLTDTRGGSALVAGEGSGTGVAGGLAQLFLDAQQLVVFR